MAKKGNSVFKLGRDFYEIARVAKVTGKPNKTLFGYVSCRRNVSDFLDITSKRSESKGRIIKRAGGLRSTAIADGVRLGNSSQSQQFSESESLQGRSEKVAGVKKVLLKTTILVPGSQRKKGIPYQTVSLAFPRWCRTTDISDWLGSTIPAGKFTGAQRVIPRFYLDGGKSYPILTQEAATSLTGLSGQGSSTAAELSGSWANLGQLVNIVFDNG